MLRQFLYKPEHAGLSAWPSGELRLEGIEITDDPHSADIFVCPGNFRIFETYPGSGIVDHAKLYQLPYLRGNESRTAVFDCSDNFKTPINLPLLFIRCDVRTWMLPHDPNTISVAWPSEDCGQDIYMIRQTNGRQWGPSDAQSIEQANAIVEQRKTVAPNADFYIAKMPEALNLPDNGFTFDVSCQAWDSTQTRIDAANACTSNPFVKSDIQRYKDFSGYLGDNRPDNPAYDPVELERRRLAFRRSMRESRLALCGESIPGVLPYRFFEAMSAGRIPLLVSSDYVLPFEKHIPYDDFIIRVERGDASQADIAALAYLDHKSDHELIERGLEARHYWTKFLDARLWPKIMADAVTDKLKALSLVQ